MDDKPKRPPRKKPAAKRPARKAAAPEDAARQGPAPEEPATAAPEAAVPSAEEPTTAGAAAGEPTTVMPPIEEQPTAVIPPDAEATALMPPAAADAEATALMPPAAAGAAQPVASAPIGYAPLSRTAVVAPPRETRPVLWIVAVAAVVAIAAIALMWVLVSGGGEDAFIGTWARNPAVGGGVIVEDDGDGVMVTWFDGQLSQQGPLPASLDGDVISFQIPDVDGQTVDATLTTTANSEELQLSLAGVTELLTKAGTLAPAPGTSAAPTTAPTATPSPSPSPTESSSLSPSPTPSGSGSPSPSPSASGSDQAVVNAILALQAGVLQYAGTHGNIFPHPPTCRRPARSDSRCRCGQPILTLGSR